MDCKTNSGRILLEDVKRLCASLEKAESEFQHLRNEGLTILFDISFDECGQLIEVVKSIRQLLKCTVCQVALEIIRCPRALPGQSNLTVVTERLPHTTGLKPWPI